MKSKLVYKSITIVLLVTIITLFMSGCAMQPSTLLYDDVDIQGTIVSSNSVHISYFLSDLNYIDIDETIAQLKQTEGGTTLTVPLVWSFLFPEKNVFTPEVYTDILDKLEKEGFDFIFVLDGGARRILNDRQETIAWSIPEWIYAEPGFETMEDFTGNKVAGGRGNMQYSSITTRDLYVDFCDKTIAYFGNRYAESIVGFAPGIMSEFEIKYPQENFCWNDYSENAEKKFKEYCQRKYGNIDHLNEECSLQLASFDEIKQPKINYNNTIVSGELKDDGLYTIYQNFRMDVLIDFVIPIYDTIHDAGFKTISYFGQILHPHDGIYNAGVAVELADYVDIAIVDYNFYDGYGIVLDTIIPAMLTNYLKTAGYESVWSGIYLERLDISECESEIQESIDFCCRSGVNDGFEIGGLNKVSEGGKFPTFQYDRLERVEDANVAIYASEWNFYHSHGESSEYINYFTDCVAQMYKIVQFELGIPVDIIHDGIVLSEEINDYDLIIAPGCFFVDTECKDAIKNYVLNGGKLLQDFRFGEWDEYCNHTNDWLDNLYGIEGREALDVDNTILIAANKDLDVEKLEITESYSNIPSLYAVAANEMSSYLFSSKDGQMIGLINEKSICLGFQPQIQYKFSKNEDERAKYIQVIAESIDYLIDA